MTSRIVSLVFVLSMSVAVFAQERARTTSNESSGSIQSTEPADQFAAQMIPRNSRVFISPIDSPNAKRLLDNFEDYLAAALRKKNVPLIMVTDRSQADFEIVGTAESREPHWDQKLLTGDFRDTIYASISVINIRTGVISYADSSYREAANRGPRSSAEKLAKYLKKKIEDDEKKLLKIK
jgi:hypothetical protein